MAHNNKNYYHTLDILKFLFSFCVIAIHVGTYVPTEVNCFFQTLLEVSVPFFFVVSGFFFGGKRLEGKEILHYCRKYIALYLIWTLIYSPISFSHLLQSNNSFFVAITSFIRNIVLYGQNNGSWSLWYLHSLAISFLLIYLFRRIRVPYVMITAIGILIFFGVEWLNDLRQEDTIEPIFQRTINILFRIFVSFRFLQGLAYVSIGILLSHYSSHLSVVHKGLLCVLLFLISQTKTPFCIFFLSAMISTVGTIWKGKRPIALFQKLRSLSTLFYLSHMLFIPFALYLSNDSSNFFLIYLLTTVSTVLFSVLVLILSSKAQFSWLKQLF